MTTIEKIRAEIKRRMFEDYNGPDAEQNETAQGVCAGILAFLDSLDAEEKADRMADALNAPFPEGVTDEQIIVQVVERNLQKDVVEQTADWVLKESLARRGAEWMADQEESYTAEVIMLPSGIKKIQHTVEGFEPGDIGIVQIRKK